jgi:hypothetical protein
MRIRTIITVLTTDRMLIHIATDTLILTVTPAHTMAVSIGAAVMGNVLNTSFAGTDSAEANTDFVVVSVGSAAANMADTAGNP